MAENVIYADLNLPESTTPRLQQVTDVQGSTYAELRVKAQGTDAAGSHSSAACPKQWEKHGRKCYFFPPFKQQDWNSSREECAAMGSDLVVIDNEDELHYLTERSKHNYYLLGLTYSEREQKWKWINSVEHDPALFNIIGHFRAYHCTVIGFGKVQIAPCGGSPTTENMCERAATMSER
ncbi:C-type lectin domain family 5 member A-like [Empidonax traillii]|uniref:C-type lectin domain family 5 member A-like n=1 Tax=Empidonax traillii TaxID=164674 RepID=UPI000FFCFD97|nr:C-type lectin domain family 5 member A-like [Empidonax traillii]